MSDENKTHEQLDNEQDKRSRDQIFEVFHNQLEGNRINECNGPNKSRIEFWQVDGRLILIQVWPGSGWDYFIQGGQGTVDKIADDIRAKLSKAE